MDKTKLLRVSSAFSIKQDQKENEVYIEGYASTTDIDRHGDVVPSSVWEKGVQNYVKNPVILAYHDHSRPIGRMVEHKIDGKGLWIKARISAAADTYKLIKDGILTAFSIGFRIIDAEYNSAAEVFLIKELELAEISVVSVPANQNTLFELSKAFESDAEYKSFKEQFAPGGTSAKGLESRQEANGVLLKEWKMNPEEIQKMLAEAAQKAAEEATKSLLAQQKAEQERQQAEKAANDALDARIKAAISVEKSGAEKLLEEVTSRFERQAEEQKSVLAGLESALKEKAEEIARIQTSKMSFQDKTSKDQVSYEDKEKAVLLAKLSNKSIEATKFGRTLVEKAGAHVPGATPWELEVSLRMEDEVRRRLVMAPLMRAVAMQTNVMKLPVNPEAGKATWIQNGQFGTANSSGATQTHQLKEVTLSAYKVATREYMAYEEEEDSLLVLLPIVRDAMIRRVARAVDAAFINGAGTASDPVTGIAMYDTASAVQIDSANAVTVAKLRAMRKDLGAWGLDPAELVYVVNTETYYNLLDDTNFLTVDKVGNQATLLTGQIGAIGNTPVIVSGEFPAIAEAADGAATNIAAFCFAPGNFVVGNQRGLRVDTQELVEDQSRVLVASLRTGLTQLTTNLGPAVSTLRYVNGAV
jgi:HK97 family phage prohead protease/HK97 family phage major capsid protein